MEVDAYIHLRLAHLIIIYYSINQGEVLGVQVNKFIILIMFIYIYFLKDADLSHKARLKVLEGQKQKPDS